MAHITQFTVKAAIGCIKLYRFFISGLLGSRCRFLPSCSEFAIEAIETYGIGRGIWLTLLRLLRCHPMHLGGYDPLPRIGIKRKLSY